MGFSLHPSYLNSAASLPQGGDAKRFNKDEWKSTDFVYDNNGNVTELLDGETGDIIGSYKYDPYGNTISIQGEAAYENKVRFSTKEVDDSGLYYYGYRYYHPQDGRWLNRDPIQERGGMNLYGMVGNDALNLYDIKGMRAANICARRPSVCRRNSPIRPNITVGPNGVIYHNGKPILDPRPPIPPPQFNPALQDALEEQGIDDIIDPALRTRCQRLRKNMKNACSGISCSGNDCCGDLSKKIDKAKECLRLRKQITKDCFGGVDNSGRDHKGQEQQVQRAIDNCKQLHQSKKC